VQHPVLAEVDGRPGTGHGVPVGEGTGPEHAVLDGGLILGGTGVGGDRAGGGDEHPDGRQEEREDEGGSAAAVWDGVHR
jgi:hypothetical protein